jgi:hypothetical protein
VLQDNSRLIIVALVYVGALIGCAGVEFLRQKATRQDLRVTRAQGGLIEKISAPIFAEIMAVEISSGLGDGPGDNRVVEAMEKIDLLMGDVARGVNFPRLSLLVSFLDQPLEFRRRTLHTSAGRSGRRGCISIKNV